MEKKYGRRLSIEALEDRSLLSVTLGISPDGLSAPPVVMSTTTQATPAAQTPAAATQLVLRLPPTLPAGVPVQITAFAANAQYQPVPSYTGTAALTSSDGGATSGGAALPVNVTFAHGRASFSVTFATPGTQSLTLTDSADSLVGTASTAVWSVPSPTPQPAPAATKFVLQLPSTVPSGLPVMVQAIAEGANDQPAWTYAGTAALSIANGSATLNGTALPANVTFTNGRAQFALVFTATGTPTLTLTDTTTSSITGSAQVTVVSGPTPTPIPTPTAPTQLVLVLPSNVYSGVPVSVQAIAEDANNKPVPSYDGTATLSIANGSATLGGAALPAQVTFDHGQAWFRLTFAAAGTPTLTLTDDTTSTLTGSIQVTVVAPPTPTPVTATQLALLLPPIVPTGVPVSVHAIALDAKNQPVPSYDGTATLSIANGTATLNGTALPGDVTFSHGEASFKVVFTETGTPTLTLTDDTTSSLAGSAKVTVVAAPTPNPQPTPVAATQFALFLPTKVVTSVPVLVEAVAEGANKQPAPTYAGTATLSITNGSATLNGTALPANVTFNHGRASVWLVFTATGSPTLTLTDNTTSSITGSAQVTVIALPTLPVPPPTPQPPAPVAPTQLALILPTTVPSGVPVLVVAEAEDASGGLAFGFSGTATLSISGGTATLDGAALPASVTFVDGHAQLWLVFTSVGTSTLTLTDSADSLTGSAEVTVDSEPVWNPLPIFGR